MPDIPRRIWRRLSTAPPVGSGRPTVRQAAVAAGGRPAENCPALGRLVCLRRRAAGAAGGDAPAPLARPAAHSGGRRHRLRRRLHRRRLDHARPARPHPPAGAQPRGPAQGDRRLSRPPARRAPASSAAAQFPARQPPQHRGALRSRQRFLSPVARSFDALFLCALRRIDARSRIGAGGQIAPHRGMARSARTGGGARNRLRLGRARRASRKGSRIARHRGHPIAGAARLRPRAAGGRGKIGTGRPAPSGLSRHRRELRPHCLDRNVRGGGRGLLAGFFLYLRRALKPGGRAALQIISIAEDEFETYRRGADFIQKYIFPGGFLPSPSALSAAAGREGLRVGADVFRPVLCGNAGRMAAPI